MLKLVEDVGVQQTPNEELRTILQELSKSSSLQDACQVASDYVSRLGHDLVSVIFCSSDDSVPAIRPFRNIAQPIADLAPKMQQIGGCPIKKEAQRLLAPFDWKRIPRSLHPDFMSQRFLSEVEKLPFAMVLAIPVVVGRGIAVFSIGIGSKETPTDPRSREQVVLAVCQIATAMISRFPELATLFEAKVLSTMQATILLFAMQGFSNREISQSIGLGEVSVGLVIKSAQQKLGAANMAQTIAKALALGEFSHMQIGEHDLI